MICPICKGEKFECKSSHILKNSYISRTKTCKKCGYKLYTLEIPRDDFNKYIKFVDDLKKCIKVFMENGES